MTADFIGKTALITGAGRGIGQAVALGLADAGVLPGMLDAGWGRVVNVSSAIAARPDAMVRFNVYAATKAALLTPGQSAAALIVHLSGDDTGAIWDVSTAPLGS